MAEPKKKLIWRKRPDGEIYCSSNNSVFRINKIHLTDTWALEVFCFDKTPEEAHFKAEKIARALEGK